MSDNEARLLLVEDSEDDILLSEEAFREAGLENPLHVVRDGVEAMAYLRSWVDRGSPGQFLVLLDINLPGLDGFEILQQIKADPSLWHLPVVMLTTSDAQIDIAKAFARGVCTYLQKPLTTEKLRSVVKHFDLSTAFQITATEAPESI